MKAYKLLRTIGLFLFVITISSCETNNNSFLEENPNGFLDPDALLTDEKGAEIYLFGAYDAIQNVMSFGGRNDLLENSQGFAQLWGILANDLSVSPRWDGRRFIYLHQVTPSNPQIEALWKDMYRSVNRVNSAVDRIGAMTEDQIDNNVKNTFVAEARFLRSMLYFGLVVAWENIPLKKNETADLNNLAIAPSSPQEVYDFIVEDLQYAISILGESQGGGRATKGAAQALLGKVYLQMSGFPLNETARLTDARDVLKEVIDSGVYELFPDYHEIFQLDNEQSTEMVFAISFEGPGLANGGAVGSAFGPLGPRDLGGGFPSSFFNLIFINTYDQDGDWRFKNNVARHRSNRATPEEAFTQETTPGQLGNPLSWRPWKWHAESPNAYTSDTPFDFPYIRYADVLLLYAEVLNNLGELTQADLDMTVNAIRARARRTPDALPDMVLGSHEENDAEILHERALELGWEGWRRTDLTRRGIEFYKNAIFVDQRGVNPGNPQDDFEDHEIRWPIPQRELDLNPLMEQNPGY